MKYIISFKVDPEHSTIIEEVEAEFNSDEEVIQYVENHKEEGCVGWERIN